MKIWKDEKGKKTKGVDEEEVGIQFVCSFES
jgi:hypothetical protein